MMEQEGTFFNSWSRFYFELKRGFLQWWVSMEDARKGAAPVGSVYVLGLQMKSCEEEGGSFKLRARASGERVYKFNMGDDTAATADWLQALSIHSVYCEDMHDYIMGSTAGVRATI